MTRDDTNTRGPVQAAWSALTHRTAVIAGSLTALVSLLCDVPVANASLRGALAWWGVTLLGKATCWALARTSAHPLGARPEPPESS